MLLAFSDCHTRMFGSYVTVLSRDLLASYLTSEVKEPARPSRWAASEPVDAARLSILLDGLRNVAVVVDALHA
jgi:hypothetical protein